MISSWSLVTSSGMPGLNHSTDPCTSCWAGQCRGIALRYDEIAMLRTYYCIPRGWNVRYYERN